MPICALLTHRVGLASVEWDRSLKVVRRAGPGGAPVVRGPGACNYRERTRLELPSTGTSTGLLKLREVRGSRVGDGKW